VVFIVLGLACGSTQAASSTSYSGTNGPAFPSDFAGTWKRDNYNNTLTYAGNQLKASNQNTYWYIKNVSGMYYTIAPATNSSSSALIGIRLVNGNLEINGIVVQARTTGMEPGRNSK